MSEKRTVFFPQANAAANAFGRVSLCVFVCLSVCPIRAPTFQGFGPEASFLKHVYTFKIFRSLSYIKVIG